MAGIVSIDEHLRRLNTHLIQGLQRLCRVAGNHARDPITSARTWQLIKDRRHLRREIHSTKGQELSQEYHSLLGEQIKTLSRLIRSSARGDAAAALRKSFQHAREAGHEALHRLCRQIAKTGRRYRAPMLAPVLQDRDGKLAADSFRILGDHFAEAERAERCDGTDIVTRAASYATTDIPIARSFSVANLCQAFAGLTAKRAPGCTGIPVEAYKFAPLEAAHHHAPILLKSILRQQCPILESGVKGVARAMRKELLSGYYRIQQQAQGGSVPGQPLQLAMAHVRGLVRRIRQNGQCGGILFVDGRSAFYSILREALIGSDSQHPVDFFQRLARQVFSTEEAQAKFLLQALGPGLLQQAEVPLALRRFITAGLDHSWFSIGQEPEHRYITRSGTVPGAPLADLYFQYIFSQVLAEIKRQFEETDLAAGCPSMRLRQVSETGAPEAAPTLPIPTWMDDIALPILAPCRDSLIDRASQAVLIVSSSMQAAGVSLNFSRGKTEFLPVIAGAGSRKLRQDWLCARGATFQVDLPEERITVHLTGRYTHLGAEIDPTGKDTPDIRRRSELSRALQSDIRRLVQNNHLTEEERLNLVISMPLARFRHGAGLWSLECGRDQQLYEAAYIEPFRRSFRALCGFSSRGLTDADVAACLGVLTAAQARHADLIRHAGWLWANGSPAIRELWFQQGAWLRDVQAAIAECAQVLGQTSGPTWDALTTSPCCAKLWARSYARKCRQKQQARKSWIRQSWSNYASAREKGCYFIHISEKCGGHTDFPCPECQQTFATSAALGAHRRKEHGIKARATAIALGTRCDVCETEFWSTRRLREHLRRSEACLQVWEAADRTADEEVCAPGLDWFPSTKAYGPHPWWSVLRPAADARAPAPCRWDQKAFLNAWTSRASSEITERQVQGLVERGMRYNLSVEDVPEAAGSDPISLDLARSAIRVGQHILAQSAGSSTSSYWHFTVRGRRVVLRPNAALIPRPMPTEWAFV